MVEGFDAGGPGVLQTYAYDAFGNLVAAWDVGGELMAADAALLTTLLYSGEQTDAGTGLQYLRARYYDPATGRFNGLDPFAGNRSDPLSLHKYLYCAADPINALDPTGEMTVPQLLVTIGIGTMFVGAGTIAVGTVFHSSLAQDVGGATLMLGLSVATGGAC